MEKNLHFIDNDGNAYPVIVTQIMFDDNGTNRVKFLVKDPFSQHVVQRLDGDHWVLLEGDMIDEYVQRLGAVIRKNFDN